MYKNKYLLWVAAVGIVASAAIAVPVFAQTQSGSPAPAAGHGMPMMRPGGRMAPGVFGTVTAVNGATLTVTSKMMMWQRGATSTANTAGTVTTYTVDGSNAQVIKNGATSTFSSIAVNDTVMVQGTVTGTNVAATIIRDGVGPMMGRPGMRGGFGKGSSSTPATSPIQGNGEPVVGGSVTSISGAILTITNASNVAYTVDTSNAKIIKNGTTTAITNVATGDNVIVQGTVNGTAVVASSIIDQGSKSTAGGAPASSHPPQGSGFFGAIGSFFKRIFGF